MHGCSVHAPATQQDAAMQSHGLECGPQQAGPESAPRRHMRWAGMSMGGLLRRCSDLACNHQLGPAGAGGRACGAARR